MMNFEEIVAYAQRAHANHIGYDGKPYWPHVERVIDNVEQLIDALPPGIFTPEEREIAKMIAALHDTAEDEKHTGVSHEQLGRDGVPIEVRKPLLRLDRNRSQIAQYLNNVQAMVIENDKFVLIVKLGDNRENRYRERTPGMETLQKRYDDAGKLLEAWYEHLKAGTA